MDSNQPYSLDDLQTRINTIIDNSNDTPVSTDDEYEVRLNMINQSIGEWEMMDVDWDELWASHTVSSVVVAGDRDYTLSLTDLRRPGGWLKLVLNGSTSYVSIISPEQYQTYGGEARVAYFTGNNKDGWTLNLGWTPATNDNTVGATMSFPYYKYATRFTTSSSSTDKTEMSDPNYIVYDVAAMKALMEGKNNQYSVFSTRALNIMDRMKAMNDINPPYQNNQIEDIDAINFGAVIGE